LVKLSLLPKVVNNKDEFACSAVSISVHCDSCVIVAVINDSGSVMSMSRSAVNVSVNNFESSAITIFDGITAAAAVVKDLAIAESDEKAMVSTRTAGEAEAFVCPKVVIHEVECELCELVVDISNFSLTSVKVSITLEVPDITIVDVIAAAK
jgi:hypothetical protein